MPPRFGFASALRPRAVALLETRRDVARHVSAALTEKFRHQAGRRDAVHVIVAENADMLLRIQRALHPRDRRLHVQQRERIGKCAAAGEKFPRLLGRMIAAAA